MITLTFPMWSFWLFIFRGDYTISTICANFCTHYLLSLSPPSLSPSMAVWCLYKLNISCQKNLVFDFLLFFFFTTENVFNYFFPFFFFFVKNISLMVGVWYFPGLWGVGVACLCLEGTQIIYLFSLSLGLYFAISFKGKSC